MTTELYWVDGPWPGRLALAARPRGGDWLEDELGAWRRAGVETVFSLLTREEEDDLDLRGERQAVKAQGMDFLSLPIGDRQVPGSAADLAAALKHADAKLAQGRNVVVHCRQGIGRTGLISAALLIGRGWDAERAVRQLSAVRRVPIPDTPEQRRWIDRYALRRQPPVWPTDDRPW